MKSKEINNLKIASQADVRDVIARFSETQAETLRKFEGYESELKENRRELKALQSRVTELEKNQSTLCIGELGAGVLRKLVKVSGHSRSPGTPWNQFVDNVLPNHGVQQWILQTGITDQLLRFCVSVQAPRFGVAHPPLTRRLCSDALDESSQAAELLIEVVKNTSQADVRGLGYLFGNTREVENSRNNKHDFKGNQGSSNLLEKNC